MTGGGNLFGVDGGKTVVIYRCYDGVSGEVAVMISIATIATKIVCTVCAYKEKHGNPEYEEYRKAEQKTHIIRIV